MVRIAKDTDCVMRRTREVRRRRLLWACLLGLFLLGGTVTACTDYQDEVDALDTRVKALEDLVDRVNDDIDAMEVIVRAMEDGDYITDVRPTSDGYVVNFKKAGPIVIKDGKDGRDGKDAEMPDIDVKQGEDGNWYWVIDGVWLKGPAGELIRVNGRDGKDGTDGKDGQDGKDAVSPQVRINPDTEMWEVSTDGGQTWTPTGTPSHGRDGADGIDGNQFFLSVTYEVNGDGEYMVVVTRSGQTFRIPIYKNS